MSILRRRLASCAFLLIVLQSAIGIAAPLAACCATSSAPAAHAAPQIECCPAGSHAPGECPLHRRAQAAADDTRAATCRLHCDSSQRAPFLIGAAGVMPAPAAAAISWSSVPVRSDSVAEPPFRSAPPDAPPPELL
jgi:hypothetical protein